MKFLICVAMNLACAPSNDFADVEPGVKSQIYSNLDLNDLRQLVSTHKATRSVVCDFFKPRLETAIASGDLICELRWKDLQAMGKIEALRSVIDRFNQSSMDLIKVRIQNNGTAAFLDFEPDFKVIMSIDFVGPEVILPNGITVENLLELMRTRPFSMMIMMDDLKVLESKESYNFTFVNYTSELHMMHMVYIINSLGVDENLLKQLFLIGVWAKKEFDLDDSETGAKSCFEISYLAHQAHDLPGRQSFRGKAMRKMKQYLRPMLRNTGIDMRFFR